MKQGQQVKWVNGMGIEQRGVVDWEATQDAENTIPVRAKDNVIRWVARYQLEAIEKGE